MSDPVARAMTGTTSDDVGDQCDTLLTTLLGDKEQSIQEEKRDYSSMIESSDVFGKEHESVRTMETVLNRRHKDLKLHAE
jgi:hypothetical protein